MASRIRTIPLDSDSVFPFQRGVGSGTTFEVHCDWCNTTYNEGLDGEGEEGEDYSFIDFGPLTIVDCCFRELEQTVLAWAPDIVSWLDWIARKHEQLAAQNHEMAERGASALDTEEDPTEIPKDWGCYTWSLSERQRCGSMRCPLKGSPACLEAAPG